MLGRDLVVSRRGMWMVGDGEKSDDDLFEELAVAASLQIQRVIPLALAFALPASAIASRLNLIALAIFDTRTTLYACASGLDIAKVMATPAPTSTIEHRALNMWAASDDVGTDYGPGGYRAGGLHVYELSVTWETAVPSDASCFTIDAAGDMGGGRYRIQLDAGGSAVR
jgi:hypothetical protein